MNKNVKEAIVLDQEGNSIYTPEGLSNRAKQSSSRVIYRFQKMTFLQKLFLAPFFLFGFLFLLFILFLISCFFILTFLKRSFFPKK